jgi:hypothetical protein
LGKKKKKSKVVMCDAMTTVPLVNDSLIDGVPGLREFETLEGSIEKIEISMAELKISTNFRGAGGDPYFSLK